MTDKSIVIRIKAIVNACEESKKSIPPTLYATAESVAYEHIRDLIGGGNDDN